MNLIHCAGKLPIDQKHFHMLARVHVRRTGGEALRHGIATDTVATPQDGQRAQRVQGTAQATQFFAVQTQPRLHGCFQPMLQHVQVGTQPLASEARIQPDQRPGCLLHPPLTLLAAVLPAFFQLQHQIIDVLLPSHD
jgi:hypothetical protein